MATWRFNTDFRDASRDAAMANLTARIHSIFKGLFSRAIYFCYTM
jgi:hypothetical protein